jgi:dTDP-4-dehydrorhamnose reductase
MHLLITGAAGQLGQAVAAAAAGRVARLSACSHAHLNIGDGAAVEAAIAGLRPDVVINCAAYTAVDRAESEPALAFAVNAEGAATLARACRAVGALLLHVSTDYVFAGDGQHPLSEDDATGPRSAYGPCRRTTDGAQQPTAPYQESGYGWFKHDGGKRAARGPNGGHPQELWRVAGPE